MEDYRLDERERPTHHPAAFGRATATQRSTLLDYLWQVDLVAAVFQHLLPRQSSSPTPSVANQGDAVGA